MEAQRQMTLSFDRFDDDLTEQIVAHLTIRDKFRFECLNKRAQSLIYRKENTLKLELNDPSLPIDADSYQQLKRFVQKLKWLTRVEIKWSGSFSDDTFLVFRHHRIQHLKVFGDNVCDSIFWDIGNRMPHLTSLEVVDFTHTSSDVVYVTDKMLNYISTLRSLASLTIAPDEPILQMVTGDTIHWLLQSIPSLRRLVIALNCEHLNDYMDFVSKCFCAFRRVAAQNPNNGYYLELSRCGPDFVFCPLTLSGVPNNLKLKIDGNFVKSD